jgi:hypothetical protein
MRTPHARANQMAGRIDPQQVHAPGLVKTRTITRIILGRFSGCYALVMAGPTWATYLSTKLSPNLRQRSFVRRFPFWAFFRTKVILGLFLQISTDKNHVFRDFYPVFAGQKSVLTPFPQTSWKSRQHLCAS